MENDFQLWNYYIKLPHGGEVRGLSALFVLACQFLGYIFASSSAKPNILMNYPNFLLNCVHLPVLLQTARHYRLTKTMPFLQTH